MLQKRGICAGLKITSGITSSSPSVKSAVTQLHLLQESGIWAVHSKEKIYICMCTHWELPTEPSNPNCSFYRVAIKRDLGSSQCTSSVLSVPSSLRSCCPAINLTCRTVAVGCPSWGMSPFCQTSAACGNLPCWQLRWLCCCGLP